MKSFNAELMPLSNLPEPDAHLFADWMWIQRVATNFDPKTLSYPRSCMARVVRGDETIAMVPFHPFLMMESLAHNPNLTESALILALSSIDKALGNAMQDTGMYEAFFLTSNKRFADTCRQHGWKKVIYDRRKKTWLMKKQCA